MLNPLIGIIASSGGAAASTTAYASIATTTVGTAVSSITFSSIPSTYTHLQVRGILNTTTTDAALVTFNSDTGSNYSRHRLTGNGAGAGAASGVSTSSIAVNGLLGFQSTTSVYGPAVIDILDYTNTNKYTTLRALSGSENNTAGGVEFNSGLWMNTAAITTVTITAASGNFAQYSQLALYGIKGA